MRYLSTIERRCYRASEKGDTGKMKPTVAGMVRSRNTLIGFEEVFSADLASGAQTNTQVLENA